MELKVVTNQDKEFVMGIDKHIDDTGFADRVHTKSGYVIWEEKQRIGIMSHCFLWNQFPFLNFLLILSEFHILYPNSTHLLIPSYLPLHPPPPKIKI